jgi:hypothetical protein
MNVLECLKSITNYPVPTRTLTRIAMGRDLNVHQEADKELLASRDYRFAEADLMLWLSKAPSISEGGVSFGLTPEERASFKAEAQAILSEIGDQEPTYGYKGDTL